jgi:hypothetical protein
MDNKQPYRITINLDETTLRMFEEMRWMDKKNASEFARWLITDEWARRASAPITEHEAN